MERSEYGQTIRVRPDSEEYLSQIHLHVQDVAPQPTHNSIRSETNASPTSDLAPVIDAGLAERVAHLLNAKQWDQVVREAAVYFENWLRTAAGLSSQSYGIDLVNTALHPSRGTLRARDAADDSAAQGWHLIGRGFMLSVRNQAMHRLDVEVTERHAWGVLGLVSLLIEHIDREIREQTRSIPDEADDR